VTLTRDRIIAVDVGTTGLRAGVVRADLQIEAVAIQSYPTSFMHTGHAEQDPAHWWQALCIAVAELTVKLPDLPRQTAGLVFSAQLCGVVATDETGAPLRPCMIWLEQIAGPFSHLWEKRLHSLARLP